jgi:leucyl/phenylalanyl-tRNA---protein transferase
MNNWFIDPRSVDKDGLTAVGGELSPSRILDAYHNGIFPFYYQGMEIQWRSPDPRAVIPIDGLHVSKSLAKTLRTSKYTIRFDTSFSDVIVACAANRPTDKRWLVEEVINVYSELHELGWAHSIEVWMNDALVGGIYGVAIGSFFSGESMFSRVDNASKIALFHLIQHLRDGGFQLFDIQYINPHTKTLGGIEIPRHQYLALLYKSLKQHEKCAWIS